MSNATTRMLKHCGVTISVTDLGGDGPTVLLLGGHGELGVLADWKGR